MPAHYNCRSTYVSDEEELNQRPEIDTENPSNGGNSDEKNDIINLNKGFNTKDDPIREYLGSMKESYPNEALEIISELK